MILRALYPGSVRCTDTLWMADNGWAGRLNISSRRKSRLTKPPQNRREATESNNICSEVFDHSCSCAEMGHGCQRRIKPLVVVWVSGISDGPFSHHACQQRSLRFQSQHCFSAEKLKEKLLFFFCFVFNFVFLRINDGWLCLTSCLGTLLPFRGCTCLGKTKRFWDWTPLPVTLPSLATQSDSSSPVISSNNCSTACTLQQLKTPIQGSAASWVKKIQPRG